MRRTRFATGAALIALALLHGVPLAHGEQAARVAVVVTLSVNADAEQSARLSAALAQALEQELVVDAISGTDVDQKLVAGVPDDCIADAECVRTLARTLDVEQLLLLTIVRVGERFKVSVSWGDGSDGRTLSRVTIDIDVEQQDPGPVFALYATRLLPDAKPRPEPPTTKPDAKPDTKPPPAQGNDPSASAPVMPPVGLRTQGRHMTTGAWIAAGASATFLATGLGFGLSARSVYAGLSNDGCEARACADADIDKLTQRAATADIFLGAALVSGVAAALLYWRSGGRISTGNTEIATFAGRRQFGVAIGGRF